MRAENEKKRELFNLIYNINELFIFSIITKEIQKSYLENDTAFVSFSR